MYGDIVEELRFGLGVGADYDTRLNTGVRKAARKLLRTYNFPLAVRKAAIQINAAESSIVLPADAGKIKQVLLTTVEGATRMSKRLLRRPEGQFPVYSGPAYYYTEGANLILDTAMPVILQSDYFVWLWYQSTDPIVNEPWLSSEYEDVLEHMAGMELGLKMRKKEATEIYEKLWAEDVSILGRFIPELEYSDMDMGFGDTSSTPALERYPA